MAKITEKRLYAVPLQLLTSDGTTTGQVQVANACNLFVVGQLVILKSNTQSSSIFKVKRIPDDNTVILGPDKTPIHVYSDVSAYLVSDAASLEASEQNRPSVPEQEVERMTYAEEPTVARRVVVVDPCGDMIGPSNPLSVKLYDGSINIGTVNAELEVQLSAKDNDPNPGDIHDSVRIGDGTNELKVNADGSINVVSNASSTTTPTIANAPILLANTEYSYTFPLSTTQFSIRDRDGDAKTRIAYTAGGTATNYYTIAYGSVYKVDSISTLSGFKIYFQSTKPGRILEILSWA